jgi:hypothetical protein
VAFLGIGADASVEEMESFVADTGTDGFPQVIDDDGSLWLQFGAQIRSSFLFVDEDGATSRTDYGELDEAGLTAAVEDLIAG